MRALIVQTMREHLTTVRFSVGAVLAVLMVVAVTLVQIQDYQAYSRSAFEIQRAILDGEERITAWNMVRTTLVLPPSNLFFMARGISSGQPNQLSISAGLPASLLEMSSFHSDNPLLNLLPNPDVSEIAALLFSLLALLFSYDLVSGAREKGLLRMFLAYGMGRMRILVGMAIGGILTLLVLIAISLLAGLATVQFTSGIPFTGEFITAFAVMSAAILTYSVIFFALGALFSSTCKRSNLSLLFSLLAWVAFVVALPPLTKQFVVELDPLPSIEDVQMLRWELNDEFQTKTRAYLTEYIQNHTFPDGFYWGNNTGDIFGRSLFNVHYVVRTPFVEGIDLMRARRAFSEPLREELIGRLQSKHIEYENCMWRQAYTAQLACCYLPTAVLKHLCSAAAGTDEGTLRRFVEGARKLRDTYVSFQRSKGYGSLDFTTDQHRNRSRVDISGLPKKVEPRFDIAGILAATAADFALLILPLAVLALIVGRLFNSYDVR